MKKIASRLLATMLLVVTVFAVTACKTDGVMFFINKDVDTVIVSTDEVDYTKFFTLKINGAVQTITPDMVDTSNVDLTKPGSYPVIVTYATATNTYSESVYVTVKLRLATPNLTLSEGRVSWDSVTGASSYEVTIVNGADKVVETVSTTSYTLADDTLPGSYLITVVALSSGDDYVSSFASAEVSVSIAKFVLSAPVLTLTENVVSWESVENATGYDVYVNDENKVHLEKDELSYVVEDTVEAEYSVKVVAVGDESVWDNSEPSIPVVYTFVKEALAVPSVTVAYPGISWGSVEGAVSYEVRIGADLIPVSTTSYELPANMGETYEVSVRALSGDEYHKDSEFSDIVSYDVTYETFVNALTVGLENYAATYIMKEGSTKTNYYSKANGYLHSSVGTTKKFAKYNVEEGKWYYIFTSNDDPTKYHMTSGTANAAGVHYDFSVLTANLMESYAKFRYDSATQTFVLTKDVDTVGKKITGKDYSGESWDGTIVHTFNKVELKVENGVLVQVLCNSEYSVDDGYGWGPTVSNYTYTINFENQGKVELNVPKVSLRKVDASLKDGLVTWRTVDFATGYRVYINGEVVATTKYDELSYNLTSYQTPGLHELYVVAITDRSDFEEEGVASDLFDFEVIDQVAPSEEKFNEALSSENFNNFTLNFQSTENNTVNVSHLFDNGLVYVNNFKTSNNLYDNYSKTYLFENENGELLAVRYNSSNELYEYTKHITINYQSFYWRYNFSEEVLSSFDYNEFTYNVEDGYFYASESVRNTYAHTLYTYLSSNYEVEVFKIKLYNGKVVSIIIEEEYSTSKTYSYTFNFEDYGTSTLEVPTITLKAPAHNIVAVEGGQKVTWSAVEGAGSYAIIVNGDKNDPLANMVGQTEELEYTIDTTGYEIGSYTVWVYALPADGDTKHAMTTSTTTNRMFTVKLPAPVLSITENVLSWETVDALDIAYKLYYRKVGTTSWTQIKFSSSYPYGTLDTSYTINASGSSLVLTPGEYEFSVITHCNSSNTYSSDYSKAVSYIVPKYETATPEVVLNGCVLSWGAVEHIANYEIYLDGELLASVSEIEYELPVKEDGSYEITVKGIASDQVNYLDTPHSEPVVYLVAKQVLETPVVVLTPQADNALLTITSVENALKYLVFVDEVLFDEVVASQEATVEYVLFLESKGTYEVTVVATGIPQLFNNSVPSDAITYNVTKELLPSPVISIVGNTLTIGEVTNASGYEVILTTGETSYSLCEYVEAGEHQLDLTEVLYDVYTVTVKAIGDDENYVTSYASNGVKLAHYDAETFQSAIEQVLELSSFTYSQKFSSFSPSTDTFYLSSSVMATSSANPDYLIALENGKYLKCAYSSSGYTHGEYEWTNYNVKNHFDFCAFYLPLVEVEYVASLDAYFVPTELVQTTFASLFPAYATKVAKSIMIKVADGRMTSIECQMADNESYFVKVVFDYEKAYEFKPSYLSAKITLTSGTVSWTALEGVVSYELYVNDVLTKTYLPTETLSYTFGEDLAAGKYNVTVKAIPVDQQFAASVSNKLVYNVVGFTEVFTGQSYSIDVDSSNPYGYYKWTPEVSGKYTISSSANKDTYVTIFDKILSDISKMNRTASPSDTYAYNDSSSDFSCVAEFKAGKTYYIVVQMYSTSSTATIPWSIQLNA